MNINNIGEYVSNYLYIKLNTSKDPENYFNDPVLTKTIIHEYIHFIQNISTIYGMLGIINVCSKIQDFYNVDYPIKFPFVSKQQDIIFWTDCLDITENAIESNPTIPFFINSAEIKIDPDGFELIKDGSSIILYPYYVEISYQNQKQNYEFGAQAIKEAMTTVFEEALMPSSNQKRVWTLPYDLVEIIFKFNYPLLLKPEYIYAFCDACLMSRNPPEIFKYMLDTMIQTQFVPNSSLDIYIFFRSHFLNNYNYIADWGEIFSLTLNKVNDIINIKEIDFVADWILNLITHYNTLRKKTPDFFSELIKFKTPNDRLSLFYHYLNKDTSPLIFNNKGIPAYIGSPILSKEQSSSLMYWYHMSLMFTYIFKNNKECPFECKEKCKYRKIPYKKKVLNNSFIYRLIVKILFILHEKFGCFFNIQPCLFTNYSRSFGLYKHTIKE